MRVRHYLIPSLIIGLFFSTSCQGIYLDGYCGSAKPVDSVHCAGARLDRNELNEAIIKYSEVIDNPTADDLLKRKAYIGRATAQISNIFGKTELLQFLLNFISIITTATPNQSQNIIEFYFGSLAKGQEAFARFKQNPMPPLFTITKDLFEAKQISKTKFNDATSFERIMDFTNDYINYSLSLTIISVLLLHDTNDNGILLDNGSQSPFLAPDIVEIRIDASNSNISPTIRIPEAYILFSLDLSDPSASTFPPNSAAIDQYINDATTLSLEMQQVRPKAHSLALDLKARYQAVHAESLSLLPELQNQHFKDLIATIQNYAFAAIYLLNLYYEDDAFSSHNVFYYSELLSELKLAELTLLKNYYDATMDGDASGGLAYISNLSTVRDCLNNMIAPCSFDATVITYLDQIYDPNALLHNVLIDATSTYPASVIGFLQDLIP